MQAQRLRAWRWALPCLGLLLCGAAWRWPTLIQSNYLRFAAGHLSYSDVVAFHSVEIVTAHRFPYLQQDIEYPVLTGLAIWLTGFAPGVKGYFLVNATLLVACGLGCL